MLRIGLLGAALGMLVGAATAIGAPGSSPTAATVRSEQARGAEAIMDLLEQKERGLARREATLSARESDLRAAEAEVQARIEELQGVRENIRQQLVDLDEQQKVRVTKLVKMLESMRDKQAAAVLNETDDVVALEVLTRMNVAKAGKAMAAMDPVRAALFADKLGEPPLSAETP